jgi:hypothetical protein
LEVGDQNIDQQLLVGYQRILGVVDHQCALIASTEKLIDVLIHNLNAVVGHLGQVH